MPRPHSTTTRRRPVHYTLSTHWDREWRDTFQGIRYTLIQLMDRVLAGIEDGRLKGPFVVDGQSIPVDDYLEIRPDRRAQVERFAREGKLKIGPWYSMPDEFTVSGEALVRNLLVGRDSARAYGGTPSAAGYVPDMFGHTSQLPQIFAGFGIRVAYIWRGVNNWHERNFLWRGADGTEVVCHKFAKQGYGTFAHQVGRGHEPARTPENDPAELARLLDTYLAIEAKATAVDAILIHDACDHQEWNDKRYALHFAALAGSKNYELIHTDLDQYAAALFAQRARIKTRLTGELRAYGRDIPGADPLDHCQQWVIPGVLSSRIRLKQANSQCQTLLCHWAEPFTAVATAALGADFAPGFLDTAWRWLLQNHAHDSIDGCSLDQIHRDMAFRFDQCRLIADKLTIDATSRLAASVTAPLGADEMRVTVFNPAPRDFAGVTELSLEIPTTWPSFNEFFGFEPKTGFLILDADGREIPYQRLSQTLNRMRPRIRTIKFAEGVNSHHIKVALRVAIPALGYTTLRVTPVAAGRPTRYPETPGLATSERAMANEHLAVQIEANGTLTLTDRKTRRTYRDLLTFEERADIGDGWYHGVAVNDQVFASSAARADVALVHNGPLLTTFRIRTTMAVPAEFDFPTMTRSPRFTELVIDTLISLRPGQDFLDIQTTVENNADDHRLRVLFPTGVKANTYLSDAAFDVVERPIALPADTHTYRETPVETNPQQTWSAVHDARTGLAVVADALLEATVRDLPDRPIALTLFRGTRRTVFTAGEPDGQQRGPITLRYRLVPLAGAPDRTRLCELGQQLAAGLRAVQLLPADVALYQQPQAVPATAGWLRLEGQAVATSFRQIGTATELRLFNPHAKKITATVHLGERLGAAKPPTRATVVDFESQPQSRLPLTRGRLKLTLKPKQILTVRLT